MRTYRQLSCGAAALSAVLVLALSGCAQGGSAPSPAGSASGTASASRTASSTGNPACDLVTQEVAAKVDPGFVRVGQVTPGNQPGSSQYVCSYLSRSADHPQRVLSVALTTPAKAADIAAVRKSTDCSAAQGIGDFACFQWTGYFLGEASGASANAILQAVRGSEALELRYLTDPPTAPGSTATGPIPDGNAMAKALAQAAVDAGWGNGSALSVPSAPPVGSPTTTDNPVCAIVTADAVKRAFGATTTPQILPGESNCRHTFGSLGTPGPDSLIFSIESHPGGAPLLSGSLGHGGQAVSGVGDKALLVTSSEPAGPKSLRPAGDVPITILSLMVAKGENMAIFTAEILISPTGPTADQTKDQLLGLARDAKF